MKTENLQSKIAQAFAATAIIPNTADFFGLKPSWLVILQISARFLLAGIMSVAAVIAVVSVYNWMYNEGNEIKSVENKERLGKMLIVMTTVFILMALFRLWVPEYQSLQLPN